MPSKAVLARRRQAMLNGFDERITILEGKMSIALEALEASQKKVAALERKVNRLLKKESEE